MCDICHHRYSKEQDAVECENQGWFNPSVFPPGLMFRYSDVGIFAIPTNIQPTKSGYRAGHIGYTSYFACRTQRYGSSDSLGTTQCGGDYLHSDTNWVTNWISHHGLTDEDTRTPEFIRMKSNLLSIGITPSYYNNLGVLIRLTDET